jgi:hypothetical protein
VLLHLRGLHRGQPKHIPAWIRLAYLDSPNIADKVALPTSRNRSRSSSVRICWNYGFRPIFTSIGAVLSDQWYSYGGCINAVLIDSVSIVSSVRCSFIWRSRTESPKYEDLYVVGYSLEHPAIQSVLCCAYYHQFYVASTWEALREYMLIQSGS